MSKEMYYQQAFFVCLGGIVLFFWMAQPWLLGAWIVGCAYWAYLKVSQMPKSRTVRDVDMNQYLKFMEVADLNSYGSVVVDDYSPEYLEIRNKKDFLDAQRAYLAYRELFCGPNKKENLHRFFGQMSEKDLTLLKEKLLVKNVFTEEEKKRYLYPSQRDQEYFKIWDIFDDDYERIDYNKTYPKSCYLQTRLSERRVLINSLCEEAIGLTVFD